MLRSNFTEEGLLRSHLKLKYANQNPLLEHYSTCSSIGQINSLSSEKTTMLHLVKSICPGSASLDDLLAKVKHISNCYHICGKVISSGETIYTCADCSQDKTGAVQYVQCKECFDLSNHKGHKTMNIKITGTAICDCGDSSVWDPKGSCEKHREHLTGTIDKLEEETPLEIQKGYLCSLSQIFVSLFDHIAFYQRDGQVFLNIIKMMRTLNRSHDCFKRLCVKFLAFMAPIECQIQIFHVGRLKSVTLNEAGWPLEYSFAELLANWDYLFPTDLQRNIRLLLTELFVDSDFKEFYSNLYPKLLNSYFYESPCYLLLEPSLSSENANLHSSLFSNRRLKMIAASSKEVMNFLQIVKRSCSSTTKSIEKKRLACWTACMNLNCLISEQEPAEKLIRDPKFVSSLFELIKELNNMEPPQSIEKFLSAYARGDSNELKRKTLAFSYILDVLETLFARLFNTSDPDFQIAMINSIFSDFLKILEESAEKTVDCDAFAVLPGLSDSFGLFFLMWYRHCGNLEKFVEKVKESLKALDYKEDAFLRCVEAVFQKVLITLVQTLTLQRIKRYKAYAHIINSLQDYMQHRMAPKYLIGCTEVCLVQLLAVFDQKQDWIPHLANSVLKVDHTKPKTPIIGLTFFEFIELIFSDIIAPLNVFRSQSIKGINSSLECDSLLRKIERQVLLNYLHAVPLSTYDSFQKLRFLINFRTFDDNLKEIATYDQSTNKIKLKDTFKNKEILPDLFYSNLELHELLANKLAEFSINIATSTASTKEIEWLNPLTRRLEFTSILPHATVIAKYLLEKGGEEEAKKLQELHPFFDRQLEHLRNIAKNDRKQILEQQTEINYFEPPSLSEEESKNAYNVIPKKYFCRPKDALETVIAHLEKNATGQEASNLKANLSNKFAAILKATYDEEQTVQEEEKVSAVVLPAKENNANAARQRALMEKFQNKRAKVIEQQVKQDPITEEEKKQTLEEVQYCAFCLEALDASGDKLYGMLCYSYHSNYYTSCLRNSYPNRKTNNISALVIDSCHHLLHDECMKKMRGQTNVFRYYETEIKCPLCKNISNMILHSIEQPLSANSDKSPFSFEFVVSDVECEYNKYQCKQESIEYIPSEFPKSGSGFFDELGIVIGLSPIKPEEAATLDVGAQASHIIINNIAMVELTGTKLFMEKRLAINTNVARALRSRCLQPSPAWLWNQHNENAKFLDSHFINVSSDNLNTIFGIDGQIRYFKLILTAYLLDTADSMNSLRDFFRKVLLTNLIYDLLDQFYRDRVASNTDSSQVHYKLAFQDFLDSLSKYLFCGNTRLTTLLRKYFCFGLSLDLYGQKTLKSEEFSDSEEFMIKFLFGVSDKDAFILNLSVFLQKNLNFFDNIMKLIPSSRNISDSEETKAIQAIIPLEKDYNALRKQFEAKKCTICSFISKKGLVVCLLCGEITCINKCESSSDHKGSGNMHKHATKAHNGICAIMELNSGAVILINSPENVYKSYLYMSQLGQTVDLKKPNWEEFALSSYELEKIRKIIVLERIPQEVHHIIELCQRSPQDRYY